VVRRAVARCRVRSDSPLEGDGFEPSVLRPRRALLSGPSSSSDRQGLQTCPTCDAPSWNYRNTKGACTRRDCPANRLLTPNLTWVQRRAEKGGAVFVAEIGRAFAGFAAGWIVEDNNIAETADF
jgi:hypothetical protein